MKVREVYENVLPSWGVSLRNFRRYGAGMGPNAADAQIDSANILVREVTSQQRFRSDQLVELTIGELYGGYSIQATKLGLRPGTLASPSTDPAPGVAGREIYAITNQQPVGEPDPNARWLRGVARQVTAPSFVGLGYDLDRVVVGVNVAAIHPIGDNVSGQEHPAGTILKAASSPDIYMLEGQDTQRTRRKFKDDTAFSTWGAGSSDPLASNDAVAPTLAETALPTPEAIGFRPGTLITYGGTYWAITSPPDSDFALGKKRSVGSNERAFCRYKDPVSTNPTSPPPAWMSVTQAQADYHTDAASVLTCT